MPDIYAFLDAHDIGYQRHDHPAVYTVAEAGEKVPDLPGAKAKNLFLRDGSGKRHFLIIVPAENRVDLKALSALLAVKRLGFGSPERLKRHLGVTPGAVSLLAVVNDTEGCVEVVVDSDLWASEAFQFHPLVNTATLVMAKADLDRFARKTDHDIRLLSVPG